MPTLGGRLRAARERKGWTQTYVCKKLGIPNGTFSGYERDYRTPDPELLIKLAELYEVTTDYLLGRTDNPQGNTNQEKKVPYRTDLKEVLEKDKEPHWGGVELTEDEKRILAAIFRASRERDEEAAALEEATKKKRA